jgi:hypothetical protein
MHQFVRVALVAGSPTGTPTAPSCLVLRMIRCTAPVVPGFEVSEAMSFNTSFAKLNSDTSRFSFAFSCSSSFSGSGAATARISAAQ